jgi:hypothetical protein
MFNGLRNAIEISTTIAAFTACAWMTAGPVAGLVTAAIVAAVIHTERTRGAFATPERGLEAPANRSHIGAAGPLTWRPVRTSSLSHARRTRP